MSQSANEPRQLLSSLMDGEISELELRRILRETRQSSLSESDSRDDLLATWDRYNLVRSVLAGEVGLPHMASEGFSARVMAEVNNEAAQPGAARSSARWTLLPAKLAVAASVTLAVFIGLQALLPGVGENTGVSSGSTAQINTGADALSDELAQREAQQRLNEYIQSVSIPSRQDAQRPVENILTESPLIRTVSDRELIEQSISQPPAEILRQQ